MTMLTGRLRKRILECKLPDKVILAAIAFAERGGLNPAPAESPHEALADAHGIALPEPAAMTEAPAAEAGNEAPSPKPRRRYNRRDMRAE